jgi:hypothetical protein
MKLRRSWEYKMNESSNEKYLGMPLDVGASIKKSAFKYQKDRIWKRVQGLIKLCLSAGGKEVLIKSVAQAIPTYSMSYVFQITKRFMSSHNLPAQEFLVRGSKKKVKGNLLGCMGRYGETKVLWRPRFQGYRAFQFTSLGQASMGVP